MKKLIYSILLMSISFSFQSCLHDNEETFDESASERLANVVSADRQMLESASNGWLMQYYAGENYQKGGYNFLMKFKGGKVTAAGELDATGKTYSSDYDVITDQGPVLTFNTYNALIHLLAEPQQENVDGYKGDYEFVIQKAIQDTVFVKGKKWKNKMRFIRMPENEIWNDRLATISNMADSIYWSLFKYEVKGDSVAKFTVDMGNRMLTVMEGTNVTTMGFIITDTGIHLGDSISVAGTDIQDLVWNGKDLTFTPQGNSNVLIKNYIPAGYHFLNEYEGTYTLDRKDKDFKITLSVNETGDGLVGTPVNSDEYPFSIKFGYDKLAGTLSLGPQTLGEITFSGTVYTLGLYPWDDISGYFTWSDGVGMIGTMQDNGSIAFTDNLVWGTYPVNSFRVRASKGPMNGSTYDRTVSALLNGYDLPDFKGLVK